MGRRTATEMGMQQTGNEKRNEHASISAGSVSRLVVQNAQNVDKQINNIKVKADISQHPFLRTQPTLDEPSVVHNVQTENDTPCTSHHQVKSLVVRHKHPHKPDSDQNHETTKEPPTETAKVPLALEGEECKPEEGEGSNDHGLENDLLVDVSDHGSERDRFEDGEEGEKDDVCGVGVSLPVEEAHGDKAADEGHDKCPLIRLHPASDALSRHDRGNSCSAEDLEE